MTTANIGIRSGNLVVPYSASTKRTKELDISAAVTGTPTFTPVRAQAIFYADSAGIWRMRFNIEGTVASGSRGSGNIVIANVVFKNVAGAYQAVTCYALGDISASAITIPNGGQINYVHDTFTTTGYSLSGDVELNAEPTTYTVTANMEGVVAADVYIPSASSSVAGVVDTTTQTFAGNKTFTGFTALGSGNIPIKIKYVSGTTPGAEGGTVTVAHGLTGDKILGFLCKVISATNVGVPPSYTGSAEYQYDVYHDATNFNLQLHATNSGNILSKAFNITILYFE